MTFATILSTMLCLMQTFFPSFSTVISGEIKNCSPISIPEPDTLDMLFIGDVMMHSEQLSRASTGNGYDFSGYFDNISRLISASDLSVANMEFTVGVEPYTGYPCFSAPYEIIREAADKGIDIMLSANNHICDKGSKGLKSTLEAFSSLNESHGTLHTGAYKDRTSQDGDYPLIVEKNGVVVAILNFTYGTNGIPVPEPFKVNRTDTTEILKAILKAEEAGADIIIAAPHWGEEYRLLHNRSQERLAEWLISKGVDAIVGTHPHTPQELEYIDGKPVFYSLGNYISNMSLHHTQVGLAAMIRIVKRNGSAKIDNAYAEYLWCSRAGHKEKGYTTIIIDDYIGRREEWILKYDYDKMLRSVDEIEDTIKLRANNN